MAGCYNSANARKHNANARKHNACSVTASHWHTPNSIHAKRDSRAVISVGNNPQYHVNLSFDRHFIVRALLISPSPMLRRSNTVNALGKHYVPGLQLPTHHFKNGDVPLLHAPKFPSRTKDPDKHARFVLLLFKPFTEIRSLRKDGQRWRDALAEFENGASPRVRRLIENVDALYTSHSANEAHRENLEKQFHERVQAAKKGACLT